MADRSSLGAKSVAGVTWSYLSIFAKALLTLAVLSVLARTLTPREFGLFGIAWIVADLAVGLGQASIGHALVQLPELKRRHLDLGLALSLIAGVGSAGGVWLLAPTLAGLFNEPTLSQYLRVFCLAFVVASLSVVPAHWLRRQLRFKQLRLADLLAYGIGYGILATSLALLGFGVWALVAGELARVSTFTVAVMIGAPAGRPRLVLREAKELISRSGGYALIQGLDFVVRNVPHLVVARGLGLAALGHYNRAERLTSLLPQYISQGVFEVVFAAVALRQRTPERVRLAYAQTAQVLALASVSLCVLLFVAAPELVAALFGDQWERSTPVLRVLALAVPLQVGVSLSAATLRGFGDLRQETWRHGAHALLLVAGAWFGARWGIAGVAAAVVIAQAAAWVLLTQAAIKRVDLRAPALLRSFRPALWVCVWTTPATWLAANALRNAEAHLALALPAVATVWAAVAIAAVFWAPSSFYPTSIRWALDQVRIDTLGAGGKRLMRLLKRLVRE